MARLNRFIEDWVREGLINSSQGEKILDYEKTKHKRPWVIYAFIMLGVSILSIGIISLIASNWQDIPPWVKLAIDFAILISIALAVYKVSDKNNPAVFDGIVAFFVLFYLASIGLISQIYHTGGQLYQALLLLCVAMLPVVLMTYKKFLPHLWTIIFLTGVILLLAFQLEKHDREENFIYYIGIMFSLPMICGILTNLLPKVKTLDKLAIPFLFWGVMFYFAALCFFDFTYSMNEYPFRHADFMHMKPYYFMIGLFSILFFLSVLGNKAMRVKVKVMTVLLGLLYCFMTIFMMLQNTAIYELFNARGYDYDVLEWFKVFGPLQTITALLLFSFIFSSLNYKKLFSAMIILIGIRFLIVYFQVFGSLTYTGFGLIFSGLMIIGLVVVWYKFNKKIESKIGGLIK